MEWAVLAAAPMLVIKGATFVPERNKSEKFLKTAKFLTFLTFIPNRFKKSFLRTGVEVPFWQAVALIHQFFIYRFLLRRPVDITFEAPTERGQ